VVVFFFHTLTKEMTKMFNESKRSDEEILTQAPIKATFGVKEYPIKPLRILKQQEWRDKLITDITEISKTLNVAAGTDTVLLSGLGYTMLRFPKKLIELVFAYAPDLPKDEILEAATEEQFAKVFGQIMVVAFPFRGELQMISQVLGSTANFPR
jgi:hypothetical protein